jgi:hypothetical protein
MDARQLFQEVVSPNYYEFFKYQNDVRLLWNAVVSMNSVAEYMALKRLGYREVSRQELTHVADGIRERHDLEDLKECADTFKHLRKVAGSRVKFTTTGTSTGVTSDTATWMINDFNVVDVLRRAFEKLDDIPELE